MLKPLVTVAMLAAWAGAGALSPGLVASATDGQRVVMFVAPTPNFALTQNQSIHPQLGRSFKVEWNGFLQIPRAGEYMLSGAPEIFVNGERASGTPIKLVAGEIPLQVDFERRAGAAVQRVRFLVPPLKEGMVTSSLGDPVDGKIRIPRGKGVMFDVNVLAR